MRKPTCYICEGKVMDNTFIYLPKEKKLVHVLCFKLRKDVTVYVNTVTIGSEQKL